MTANGVFRESAAVPSGAARNLALLAPSYTRSEHGPHGEFGLVALKLRFLEFLHCG